MKNIICYMLGMVMMLGSGAVFSETKWPVSLTIDPTSVEYHAETPPPAALICVYTATDSYSQQLRVPIESNTYSFNKETDHSSASTILYCDVSGVKSQAGSLSNIFCSGVNPGDSINLGSAIKSGQCRPSYNVGKPKK